MKDKPTVVATNPLPQIRGFLAAAFDDPAPSEEALAAALDELAAVAHRVPPGRMGDDTPDPPDGDTAILRDLAKARFPTLGLYAAADPLRLTDAQPLIGDAIDDIADLALDLRSVLWLAEHAGMEAACWQFHLLRFHWGAHLHQLRLCLHARRHR